MLMNSHFPVKMFKNVSAIFMSQVFQGSYDVGKSITWLCMRRKILPVFHWKTGFSHSFRDTSMKTWATGGHVPCLKCREGDKDSDPCQLCYSLDSPRAPSVPLLASTAVAEVDTLETTSGGTVNVHVIAWQTINIFLRSGSKRWWFLIFTCVSLFAKQTELHGPRRR